MNNEKDYLLKRHIVCPVCEKTIEVLTVKSARVVRTDSDMDLRPRTTTGFDSLKYGVCSCYYCGYTALSRTFGDILRPQKQLIRDQITPNYTARFENVPDEYSYNEAIYLHKLSLINTLAKHGKMSEKAYNALLIAWLYRGAREELEEVCDSDTDGILECRRQELSFLRKAYDGFTSALAVETPPFVGMDMITTEYLMAALAWELEDYENAARLVSQVLIDKGASSKVKDRALTLKEDIFAHIRAGKK